MHLCEQHKISPADVLFVFDDVLDFSVAKLAGVRFMIGRPANPLLSEFAAERRLVDYITLHSGNENGVREVSEIIMSMANNFEVAIELRMKYGDAYKDYLAQRNKTEIQFFTTKENGIIPG